jgi:hypothetical protein
MGCKKASALRKYASVTSIGICSPLECLSESLQMLGDAFGMLRTKLGILSSNQKLYKVRPSQMFSHLLTVHPKIVKKISECYLDIALNVLVSSFSRMCRWYKFIFVVHENCQFPSQILNFAPRSRSCHTFDFKNS